MTKTALQLALMFVLVVMAQAVIFNRIVLFGVAVPFIFIYFIIKLPVAMTATRVMLLSFLLGAVMDIFQDTPGLCALSCTWLGASRRTVLRLLIPREDDIQHASASIRSLGIGVYSRYVITMSLIFCIIAFSIEAFSFFGFKSLLLRIVCSATITSLLLIAIDSLSRSRSSVSEKRL